ncbi:hypothetical protein QUB37_07310 [Microcoleus sp. AT3-A2]|uniref:hypothetical protein n=1 Tax=Microcoleus sp. AT3-A2 TaxID=2818610 RepID=UPI002FD1684B
MLLRFAKLAGGLRLLIAEVAPLVVVSASMLSARSAAYLVGFTLGSIGATLWPIVAVLIAIAGIINPASQEECDNYYAQVYEISQRNALKNYEAYMLCWGNNGSGAPSGCFEDGGHYNFWTPEVVPCTPPDCDGKKVWLQTIWASPSEFASQSKGCFLIGYSYSDIDGLKIEYNPFKISESFLQSRALYHHLVAGNRFKQLNDEEWKDLESSSGWDKGYWNAEFTDVECRGWRPGWSNKVK